MFKELCINKLMWVQLVWLFEFSRTSFSHLFIWLSICGTGPSLCRSTGYFLRLHEAARMGLSLIVLESDSQLLVNELLLLSPPCTYHFRVLIDEARYMASLFSSCTFCFALRLVNSAAHVVARHGLSSFRRH